MASNIASNIVDTNNNASKISDYVGKLFDPIQLILKYMVDHSVDHLNIDYKVCCFCFVFVFVFLEFLVLFCVFLLCCIVIINE